MSGDPEKEEKEDLFRPVWELDDDDELEPPGPVRARKRAPAPDYNHRLMTPLVKAHDAVARLESKLEMASEAVAEGLRARMSYLEAAGWLEHAHVRIHPRDLALSDHGITSSYTAAAFDDHLGTVLPATVSEQPDLEIVPFVSDRFATHGLRLAREWRRLAEIRSWGLLSDSNALRQVLNSLGSRQRDTAEIEDWMLWVDGELERGPALIRAGRAALDWMSRPGINERNSDGVFLAACLWRRERGQRAVALPFWAAPDLRHHRLSLQAEGMSWVAEFLECVTAAAIIGLQEFERVHGIEDKGRSLGVTKGSRLPEALDAVIRTPIVTVRSLAEILRVTPRAAHGLLDQLVAGGFVREATGRASWRAFSLALSR
jgi:hypothetical protein